LRRAPASFDGETEENRLARRQKNWIANVEFEERSPRPQGLSAKQ
jgi:hypothetical protein